MDNIKKLIKEAQKTNDIQKKIGLYKDISIAYWQISKIDESRKYSNLTLDLAKKYGIPSLEAASLNSLGLVNVSLNNYSKALDLFFQTLKVYKSINKEDAISLTLNNIGLIYLKMNNLDKAYEYFIKALEIVKEREYKKEYNTETINIHIGIVLMKKGEYDRAMDYYNIAESFSRKHKLERSLGVALVNMGELLQNLNKYEASLQKFEEALAISRKLNDKRTIIPTLNDIGISYRKMHDLDKALEYHEAALALAEEINYKEFIINCCLLLSEDYESKGGLDKALEFHKKYTKLKDELYTDDLSKQIMEIHTSYENEKKDLETKQMLEKASRLASIGVMAAGITHEINQPLNAIKISAESVLFWEKRNPGAIAPEFLKEFKSISTAADRMNDIIQHMRSFWITSEEEKKELFSLNKAISSGLSLIERQIFSHGIEVKLDLSENDPKVEFNQIEIEQMIINLMVNSIHSLDEKDGINKKIVIKTDSNDTGSSIIIEDNGVGISEGDEEKIFDPFFSTRTPGKGMGLGLAIVHKTVEKLRGDISVKNNAWGGATFTINIPPNSTEV